MEIDFSALASRVAAFGDVLGCIILSADGLVLGAFPPTDEDGVKPAWLKFAGLGEPERGFVKFSDSEIWAYVQVGPYAAFATGTGNTRPGVLLDHMEQVLLAAQDSRDRREVARAPERVELPAARPEEPAEERVPAPVVAEEKVEEPHAEEHSEPAPERAPEKSEEPEEDRSEEPAEETEVDRVVLAREFAGLLQEDTPGDE